MMIARVLRLLSLVKRHPADLIRALVLLPIVSVRLRRHGYSRTSRWLDDKTIPVATAGWDATNAAIDHAGRCGNVVRIAAIAIPDATCLRKSLVQRQLLKRSGIPAVVRFGAMAAAGDDPDPMLFHAWVEVDGHVVSEPPEAVASFVRLNGTDQPWFRGDGRLPGPTSG